MDFGLDLYFLSSV